MEIKGKLLKKLEIVEGTSKQGKEWRKQSLLVEQDTKFNKEVVITFFGEHVDKLIDLVEDKDIEVDVFIHSREFKGNYYHNIDGFNVRQKVSNEFVTSDNTPF